jgi:hypothetical protein
MFYFQLPPFFRPPKAKILAAHPDPVLNEGGLKSVPLIQVRPHVTHRASIPITMPIASALENCYIQSFLLFLEALLDPGGGFRSETAVAKSFRK